MSKGAPHICIHRATESNLTLAAVILGYHWHSISTWLSKVQGPPSSTRSNSKSDLNLNWNKFEPTSTIYSSSTKPQALLNVFWAAFLLKGLHVRNLPIRLYKHSSTSSLRPSSEITITSSSKVNFIFSNLLITSSTFGKARNQTKQSKRQTLSKPKGGSKLVYLPYYKYI